MTLLLFLGYLGNLQAFYIYVYIYVHIYKVTCCIWIFHQRTEGQQCKAGTRHNAAGEFGITQVDHMVEDSSKAPVSFSYSSHCLIDVQSQEEVMSLLMLIFTPESLKFT